MLVSGDAVLPNPELYDQLFYELIRVRDDVDALFRLVRLHDRFARGKKRGGGLLAPTICLFVHAFNPIPHVPPCVSPSVATGKWWVR